MRPIQGTIVRFNLLLNITMALTFIVSTPCFGISTKSIQDSKKATHPFITDEFVRQQVKFWEAIFQKYDGSSVVIHDVDVPLAMIDVINFEKYVMPDGSITSINSTDQTDLVQKYIDRYYLA
ncbi:MAG: hypothetical protein NT027_18120, partial [Proteobacteria bacterium]|nr:hypothetical protein [Pseudomonadota bacterium]